ncbi:hypothetical protein [Vulgatibacter sp.]|uniref:hypothetical protein n=1 Tax=Vulgatibacter sp. TaxID=1971226 RepID=UPI0035620609
MQLRILTFARITTALSLVCLASGARADECASAAVLLERGAAEAEAEAIARRCQAAAPRDADRFLALAQLLAWQGKHAEALAWLDLGLSHHPESAQLAALRLRVLGWQGRLDEASAAAAALPASMGHDPEVIRARADVAFWRGEHAAAVAAYGAWLEGNPGDDAARRSRALALLELGDEPAAKADLGRLCAGGDASACALVRDLERKGYRMFVQGGPVTEADGLDGWIGRAAFDAAVTRRLRLGGTFDLQERRFGEEAARDAVLGATAAWQLDERWVLAGGMGAAFAPTFSPDWNAFAELGMQAGGGFWLYLRYWHLDFSGSGVEVLSPAVAWARDGVAASLRIWRGFESGRDPSLAALAQASWSVAGAFEFTAGIGGGDRADYLRVQDVAVERHVIALGGVGYGLDESWQLRADWLGRWESAGGDRVQRNEMLLGVRRDW